MSHPRLRALMAILAVVLLMRWWDPLAVDINGSSTDEVSAAVERVQMPGIKPSPDANSTASTSILSHSAEGNRPANAFEVRGAVAALDLSSSPPTAAPRRRPVVMMADTAPPDLAPPQEPAPPAPPLQIIGMWNDGQSPGVFLAAPSGTLLARQGQTLMGEFAVIKIDTQELVLKQLSNQKEWRLPIPRSATSPSQAMARQ